MLKHRAAASALNDSYKKKLEGKPPVSVSEGGYVARSGLQKRTEMLPSVEISGKSVEQLIIDPSNLDLLFGDHKCSDCGSGFCFEFFPKLVDSNAHQKLCCDCEDVPVINTTPVVVLTVMILVLSHKIT